MVVVIAFERLPKARKSNDAYGVRNVERRRAKRAENFREAYKEFHCMVEMSHHYKRDTLWTKFRMLKFNT